ncbi:DUF4245 domain-containing protein [Streptomyces sp. H27-D2]|uniref:DUF4245 domain-containing protein n=1 Tax=Streptomyces sp. H27-D2 TaxID=3046304 RepID=UPI003FA68BCA
MVLSMAVIGAVVAGIYVFIPHDENKDPVKPVSYRVEVDTARRAAPYAVAAPESTPKGWRATSVSYNGQSPDGAVWHLGFLDQDKEYAAVEQSDGPAKKFIATVTQGARKTDVVERIGGVKWDRYQGSQYNALVRAEPGVTTVVTGTVPHAELAKLAAALKVKKT